MCSPTTRLNTKRAMKRVARGARRKKAIERYGSTLTADELFALRTPDEGPVVQPIRGGRRVLPPG